MVFHSRTDGQTERQNSTIETYLRTFVKWEQNNCARLLPIAEYIYNNTKNASTGHMPFKFNCGCHPQVSFKNNVNSRFKSRFANKQAKELREQMNICQQNLFYAQELQKKVYDKGVKPRSYVLREKVWLNSKYIKTKQN